MFVPDCDIILGGFPCQDFSMIWKQPGLEGERGNLYKSLLKHQVNRFRAICTVCGFVALS
ncbi:DNA cytosine methyltransferase [Neisseria sp. SLRRB23]|uniref:DNA cytosine methyltransferase n=1 Tax=Neisseria sp. SLRRB23 TaxID=3435199 RepID=UPI003D7F98B2